MNKNWNLSSEDQLTQLAMKNGLNNWTELTEFIRVLPYGRNKNRRDFEAVFIEKRGTCSSKHALLKEIADRNNFPKVHLILGIYQMNAANTPKIGDELEKYSVDYLPEAHCYLKVDGIRMDFTTKYSSFNKIEKDVIREIEIQSFQVAEFKVEYHKSFIINWLKEVNLDLDFEQIWQIRENCIRNLSE